MKEQPITSDDIKSALAAKHHGDIFVPECNNGPTGSQYRRIDAWVMNRSWARLTYTGYEIKISRSDFLQDKKWVEYLPMCHQLYFVTPRGLVTKSEIPPECGFAELVGNRILTRKLAPRRNIEHPVQVLQYIMMSRATISKSDANQNRQFWEQWLIDAEADKQLGYAVRNKLSEITSKIHQDNLKLQRENESLNEIKLVLEKLGLSAHYVYSHTVENRLRELLSGIPADVEHSLSRIKNAIEIAEGHIKNLKLQAGAA